MDETSEAINFQLVDFYPVLRHIIKVIPYWVLPMSRKLHELQKLEDRVFYSLLNRAKEKLETGDAAPSLLSIYQTKMSVNADVSRFHPRHAYRQGRGQA